MTVAATADSGFVLRASTDDEFLLFDHFSRTSGSWKAGVGGLETGVYDIYLYAPSHADVPSGSMTINGTAVASIPGDPSGSLIEGTSFVVVTTTTTSSGGIEIFGAGATLSGLSGIQVVPEPDGLLMLLPGIALLSGLARRRLARRGQADCK